MSSIRHSSDQQQLRLVSAMRACARVPVAPRGVPMVLLISLSLRLLPKKIGRWRLPFRFPSTVFGFSTFTIRERETSLLLSVARIGIGSVRTRTTVRFFSRYVSPGVQLVGDR